MVVILSVFFSLITIFRVSLSFPAPYPRKQTATSRIGARHSIIPVLHETDQVLVINKPPGIPHHDSVSSNELGIINLLRSQREERGDSSRLYGIHRLDRVTSGILVLAKSSSIAGSIQRLFREGKVVKYYVGLSSKKAKKKQGIVTGNMVRGRRKSWFLTREAGQGNQSRTHFYTSGLGKLEGEAKTLLLFRPYTGKTHQLRVASKSVGLPLLGDPIYGTKSVDAPRTFLHAYALHIPGTELHESITVRCDPPFDSAWQSDSCREAFRESFETLLKKHCEFKPFFLC